MISMIGESSGAISPDVMGGVLVSSSFSFLIANAHPDKFLEGIYAVSLDKVWSWLE